MNSAWVIRVLSHPGTPEQHAEALMILDRMALALRQLLHNPDRASAESYGRHVLREFKDGPK